MVEYATCDRCGQLVRVLRDDESHGTVHVDDDPMLLWIVTGRDGTARRQWGYPAHVLACPVPREVDDGSP
jgi:hypothetical protein